VGALKTDYRTGDLTRADRAMLDFAVKLTESPRSMSESDVAMLREAGFSDVGIHDIAQVAALFNYYNRIADGLGIDPEPDHPGPHRHGG